ncbi:hypothetical protein IAU60_000271 [Kwoniella sp. DSM 27419]
MKSWRSNLLCLLVLAFVSAAVASANAVQDAQAESSPAATPIPADEGWFGFISRLTKVAINGPDYTVQYAKDKEDGVERLTDDNYVSEVEQSGDDAQVWVVLVHGRPEDAASQAFLHAHKEAAQQAKSDPTLQRVKWARLDFITHWQISTRWLLTKPPYLVFISHQGRDLRFLRPIDIRPEGDALFAAIKQGSWADVPIYKSRWAPGGDRAFLLEAYISASSWFSAKTARIPSWVFMLVGGMIVQQTMRWLHGDRGNVSVPLQGQTLASQVQQRTEQGQKPVTASQQKASAKNAKKRQ